MVTCDMIDIAELPVGVAERARVPVAREVTPLPRSGDRRILLSLFLLTSVHLTRLTFIMFPHVDPCTR